MNKAIILLIICVLALNERLSAQNTYSEICYDQPIKLISWFDAPTQNEFQAWLDIQVLNESGGMVYQAIGGPWFNYPICGCVPLAVNNLGLTNAQALDKTLTLSMSDILKKSSITKVDGQKYQIMVHAASWDHCWHRYYYFKYTFRLANPGVIGNNNDYICYNGSYSIQSISNAANEPTGIANYSWYYSNNTQIPGQTGATLTLNNITSPVSVYRKVSNTGLCPDLNSNTITINAYQNFTDANAGTISSDQSICYGSSFNTITGTSPSGGTGNYTYQWYSSTDGTNYSTAGITNSANLSPRTLNQTTWYQRVATSGSCGTATSNTVKITVYGVLAEGTIPTPQPTIAYNTVPGTLTCSSPTGGSGAYTYQWQIFSNGAWQDIPSATSASYTPPALTTATTYRRSATSGSCGTAYSNSVTINVYGQFSPGNIGSDQTICNGSTPNYLVGSEPSGGTGSYTYQWQNSVDGTNFSDIIGTTGSTYSPPALTNTMYYRRAVSSGTCGTVYSNTVKITVYGILQDGTAAPAQTICYGGNASLLSVSTPSGGTGNYTFQWQSSTDNYSWNNIAGATSTGYTPTGLTTSTYYHRVITSESCGTAYSNNVKITVRDAFNEGTPSVDQTVAYNTAPSMLSVSSPSGGDGLYTYQWQISTDKINWSDIPGATSSTYTPGALSATTYYRRSASCGCGTTYSNYISISVFGMFLPGAVGYNQSICYNTVPTQLVGSTPTGGTGYYTYQWQNSMDGSNFVDILGATGSVYTPPALTTTTYYRRAVTSGIAGTVYSNIVTVTVNGALSEGVASYNQTICYNSNANAINVTAPSGGSGTYTYQWQSCPDLYSWNDIPGATQSSYVPTNLTSTTYFRRVLTSGTCGSVNSNTVKITVYPQVSEGSTSPDQTVCYNTAPTVLSLTTPSGGTGSYTYQWQSSTDNFNWSNYVGATNSNYTPGNLTSTTYFRRVATSGTCGSANSSAIKVSTLGQITPGFILTDQTKCYGNTPDEITGTNPTGGNGSGSYTYQWQKSTDGSTWSDIPGAFNNSYLSAALTKTTYFHRVVTSGACGSATSNIVTVTVTPGLTEGIATADQTVCYSTSPARLNVTSATGGITSEYYYQWQSSSDGYSWNNVNGASTTTYSPPALTNTTFYRRSVTTASCGTAYSNAVQITVRANLTEGNISADQTICYNTAPTRISVSNASGGTGTYTYQWQSSVDNYDFTDIAGATTASYLPGALTSPTYYRRAVTSGTCGTVYSQSMTAKVLPNIDGGLVGDDQSICYNSIPATFTGSDATGGTGTYNYQWQKSMDGNTFSNIAGGTGNSYTSSALIKTSYFRRIATSGTCGSAISNVITISVNSILTEGTASAAQTVCYNATPQTLSTTVPSGGFPNEYTYQWQQSTDNYSWNNVVGAISYSYSPGSLTSNTYYRRVLSTASCGTAYSNSVLITVNGSLNEGTPSSDQTICYNTIPARLSVTNPSGGNGIFSFQWQSSTDNFSYQDIAGATTTTYLPEALKTTTYYRRGVTSGNCGTVYSTAITVNVLPDIIAGAILSDQTICYNTIPDEITGSNATGGIGTLTYQWQKSTDGKTFSNITGAIDDTYTPGPLTITYYYQRVATSGNCGSKNSNIVKINVPGQLMEGTVSASQSICYNTIPDQLSVTTPSGGMGSYTYQWQTSSDNNTFSDIPGATNITYSPGILTSDTFFRRVSTSGICGSVASNSIKIKVNKRINAGQIAASQTICSGNIPATFTGESPSGGSGGYTYQWQKSSDSIVFTNIPSAIQNTYTSGPLTTESYYRRVVMNGVCGSDTSNIIHVRILTSLDAGTIFSDQSVCYNATPNKLEGSVPNGGNGSYTYQWQKSYNNTLFVNVNGASDSYIPDPVTANVYYRRMVSSANCNSSASNSVYISVLPAINTGAINSNQSICYNTAPKVLTGETSSGGKGTFSYQWQSTSDSVWSDIPGETTLNYTPDVLRKTQYFRRITICACGSAPSNIITVKVFNKLDAGLIKGDQTICYNYAASVLSDSTDATGGTGAFTYQWQSSDNKDSWTAINSTNSVDFMPGVLKQSKYYRRSVTNTCGTAASNSVTVNVLPNLDGGQITSDQLICFNMKPNTLYGSSAMGADGNYSYQWQYSNDSLTWVNIFKSGTDINYSADTLQHTTYYRRMATSAKCNIAPSNVVRVKVSSIATPGSITSDQSICYNMSPKRLVGTPSTGGTGNPIYSWENSTDGTLWNKIFIYGDSISYTPSPLTSTTLFHRKTSMSGCKDIYSNQVVITVNTKIEDPVVTLDSTYCKNVRFSLLETSGTKNTVIWLDGNKNVLGEGKTLTVDTITHDRKIYVEAYRSDGCYSDPKELLLKFDQVKAAFSTDISDITVGNAVRFVNTSFGGKKFIWNFYDGDASHEENPWHYYNTPGSFDVQLIAISGSGCQDTTSDKSMITVKGDIALGTETITGKDIVLFPNPASDFVTILGNGNEFDVLKIYNIVGKEVIYKELNGIANIKVNISFLPVGVYTFKVHTKNEWKTYKIVKQ
jgi:hypothetical protein